MSIIENRSESAKKRNLGGKRCVRFSVSINNEYDSKLSRLAVSCDMSKSELVDQLLRICLDSPKTIDWVQNKFNRVEQYRVEPRIINNRVYY